MKQIPFYYYIAFNNPDGARAAIESFGYEITGVKNRNDLADCVKQLIQERGHDALEALARVHPDREIIIDSIDKKALSLSANGENSLAALPAPLSSAAEQPIIKPANDYTMVMIAGMFLSAIAITAMIIAKK